MFDEEGSYIEDKGEERDTTASTVPPRPGSVVAGHRGEEEAMTDQATIPDLRGCSMARDEGGVRQWYQAEEMIPADNAAKSPL